MKSEVTLDPDKKICILTFHGMGPSPRCLDGSESNFWLDAPFVEDLLESVKDRPDIKITLDDSNASDFEIAFPALLERGMHASFFVVSERIDMPGFLTSQQIQEMSEMGMTIGSHGTKHRPWATLGESELFSELNDSRRRLEEILGKPVTEAACPFGSYNRTVLMGLRDAGYSKVYTSDDGLAHPGDWILTRNTLEKKHDIRHVENLVRFYQRPSSAIFHKAILMLKRLR